MAMVQYGNSYADLNQPRQGTSGTVLNFLGLLQRGQIAQQEEDYRRQALAAQVKAQQDYLDFEKSKLAAGENPTVARQIQWEGNALSKFAEEGGIDSEAHAAQIAPSVPPGIRRLAYEQSMAVRPQIEAQANASQAAADVLNRRNQLQRDFIPQAQQVVDAYSRFIPGKGPSGSLVDRKKADIAAWNQELASMPAINPNDKNVQGLVTFDTSTGLYQPSIPRPRWMKVANVTAVTTPTAAATATGTYPPDYGPMRGAPSRTNALTNLQAPAGTTAAGPPSPANRMSWVSYRTNELLGAGLNLQQAAAQARSEYDQLSNPTAAPRFSAGGSIRGRGTSTSDNVTIRVSPGEYVVPAEAREIPGAMDELDHIRRMALHKRAMNRGGRVIRYAMGGPVARYQDGGEVDWSDFTQPSFWGDTPEDAAWYTAPTGMGSQPATRQSALNLNLLGRGQPQQQAIPWMNPYDTLQANKGQQYSFTDDPTFGLPKAAQSGRPNGYSVLSAYLGNSGGGGY